MDSTAVLATIGALTGIAALCISVFTLRDNRRKTRIMEDQLGIAGKEIERKRRYEELSRAARGLSSKIKEGCQYSLIEDLWFMHEKVLAQLHDTHAKTVELTIEPEKLEFPDGKNATVTVDNAPALERIMRAWPSDYGGGGYLHFRCTPQILDQPQDTFMVGGGVLSMAVDIWRGCQQLVLYRDLLDALDPDILHDLDKNAGEVISVAFDSLMSRREIEFKSTDKSDQIYEKLERAYDEGPLEKEKRNLVTDLCMRLDSISKEMISKL